MTQDPHSDPAVDPSLPAALLHAWLAQSNDLLALTDAEGRIEWANAAFEVATGAGSGDSLLSLARIGTAAELAAAPLARGLRSGTLADAEFALCPVHRAEMLWVRARAAAVGPRRLWTLADVTASRALAARERNLTELLDMAQEFGRLGVWEREIPSGKGCWDRHVFAFWGLDPAEGTPDHAAAAARIHPDDQTPYYAESTRRAGRYAQHYRVINTDGSVRWLHSQWEVRNGAGGTPERALGIMVDDTQAYDLARSLDHAATQLRFAAELAHIVIWRHDLKTDRVHYNAHGFEALGIAHRTDGVPLAEARSHTHPDDVPKLVEATAQALRTRAPVDVQTRHRRADGSWRHMLVRRVVECDAAGDPVAMVGVSLDVTEQVDHSRRAEELAHRLESAARAARIGIWTADRRTGRGEWNAQMYALFDRVDASPLPTLDEWLAERVHPDDAARVAAAALGCRRGEAGEVEFRIRLHDGRTRWMMLRADLDRGSRDAERIFGIAMDVTDRRRALSALHAASERAALIARQAGIGIWEVDSGGRDPLWDDQMFRLRGLEPRATAPTREERLALLHPDDRERVLQLYPEFNRDAQSCAYEFRVRWPDGSYRWLASRWAELRDEHGQTLRRVGVNWDITDSRSAAAAREQALLAERESHAKSQLLARMSHELRTPLNAVLGFTQLLQVEAQQSGTPGQLDKLKLIRAAGDHLLEMVDDVLDLSGLGDGTLTLEPQTVPLAAAVLQAARRVGEIAAVRRVAVRVGRVDGAVRADPPRLRQVLTHLLKHAVQSSRADGEVVIDATAEPAGVTLRVRDTGPGLTPDELARLFEPFDGPVRDAGTAAAPGLGLALVKALVEGMGGTIGASSEPGRGTVFALTLPAASDAQALLASSAGVDGDSAPGPMAGERSGQLLYIEDNAVNVLLVEELVTSLSGLRIVSESTGAAGVQRARELRPDVILIDMQLPDFDGFEVLRRLRDQPETADIRCIALSANAMPEDIERALANGFDDYWTKPIRFKTFIGALQQLFPVPG